jgi:iron-sulfur cluster repair protein YtfE (RIC family)
MIGFPGEQGCRIMDMGELRRQHEEISLTARQLSQAVAETCQPSGVGRLRWQLARQLMTHLALEDRLLYPTLSRSADAQTRDLAAALHRDTGALAKRFGAYMTRWSDDRIAREWSAYCADTRLILKALTERIEREDRMLYRPTHSPSTRELPLARPA